MFNYNALKAMHLYLTNAQRIEYQTVNKKLFFIKYTNNNFIEYLH